VASTEQRRDLPTLLRAAGLRVTDPRVAVLGALSEHPHSTAEVVAVHVRRGVGFGVDPGGVRRARRGTAAGLVRRIEPAGSPARFETRTADNHHHVVCRSCGTVRDVDCATADAPCLTPAHEHGLVIDEAEVVFWATAPPVTPPRLSQRTACDTTQEPV